MRGSWLSEKKPVVLPIPFAGRRSVDEEIRDSDVGRAFIAEKTAKILAERRTAAAAIVEIDAHNQTRALTQTIEALEARIRPLLADMARLSAELVQTRQRRALEGDRVQRERTVHQRRLEETEPIAIRQFCAEMETLRAETFAKLNLVARGKQFIDMVSLRRGSVGLHSNRDAIEKLIAATFEAERHAQALAFVVDVDLDAALAALRKKLPKVDLDTVGPYLGDAA